MHNAEPKTRDTKDTSELRQRKYKGGKPQPGRKMVGSGSGESLGHDVADIRMELLEFDSDDDNSDLDTKHLIPAPLPNVSIQNDGISKYCDESVEGENVWFISIQMFIPFLLAGFGMVAASLLLDVVQVIFSFEYILSIEIQSI